MIPAELIGRLRLLAHTEALPEAAAPDRVHAVTALAPGARVEARIGPTLPDGRHLVYIAERTFVMQLPPGSRPDSTIAVVYRGGEPRPTFELAANAPDLATNLSSASRLLATLGGTREAAATITAPTPLLGEAPTDTALLARRLADAVGLSGLFYESHQAQWVVGSRDTARLKTEPQAQLRTGEARATPTPPAAEAAASALAPEADLIAAGPFSTGSNSDPVHPAARPLVEQQLNALENRHVYWQGQAWPHQSLEWHITEQAPHAKTELAPAVWRSRLHLDLPRLGGVSATLTLEAGRVAVELAAAAPDTLRQLAAGSADLKHALETAGLTVSTIVEARDHAA